MSKEVIVTIGSNSQIQVRVSGSVVGEFYDANRAINVALWLHENMSRLASVLCTYDGD